MIYINSLHYCSYTFYYSYCCIYTIKDKGQYNDRKINKIFTCVFKAVKNYYNFVCMYSFQAYKARTPLAVLDHNYHLDRPLHVTSEGKIR